MAAGSGVAERDAGGEAGDQYHQLQCWGKRVRERWAVAAGSVIVERGMGSDVISHTAGISSRHKGGQ